MKRVSMLLVMLAATGCGLFKQPTTPAEQATAAGETTGKKGEWIGHVDGSLSPASGKNRDIAFSGQADSPLHFVGVSDGKLCVAYVWDYQFQPSHDTVDEINDARLMAVRSLRFEFGARAALDYAKTATWPDQPRNDATSVTLAKTKRSTENHTTPDGEPWTTEQLYTRIEVCGPVPPLDTDTKFVTVTRFAPASEHKTPALYIWRLDSPLDASLISSGDQPGSTAGVHEDAPAEAVPAPATTEDGPVGPAVPGNLIEVMIAARKYTTFLKLVEAAGLTDRLKAKGTFTVFAPDNHAFAQQPGYFLPGLLKDKVALGILVRAHVARKPYTRAMLTTGKRTDVVTISSPKEAIDQGGRSLMLGNSVIHDDQKASNGVLWTIDGVMSN